jgi:hypothetical protein
LAIMNVLIASVVKNRTWKCVFVIKNRVNI